MPQDRNSGPSSRGGNPGGGRRDGRGPGGDRGKPRRGGDNRAAANPVRAETYESLKELTRGPGFRIDKYVLAEKATHKPVRTEYRLTREGLAGTPVFSRLADAQNAATEKLPEPAPDAAEETTPEPIPVEAAPDETPPSE